MTLKPNLRLVFWETTAACNLQCRHCRRLTPASAPPPDELTTSEGYALIDSLVNAQCKILVLSGGEPLLREDIFELAHYAHQKGLTVALASNGTLINHNIARKIKEAGISRVAISLDGADANTHDDFRGQPGVFEQAISGLKALKQLSMSTQINCTIAQHNRHQLQSLYTLALELAVDALHIFLLVPVGCGTDIAPEYQLSPYEYEETLNEFFELWKESKLELRATCAPHFYRIMAQKKQEFTPHPAVKDTGFRSQTRGCLAGIGVCFISYKGEVFPCGYLPLSAGNIRDKDFTKIWQETKVFKNLRNLELLKGKCARCEFQRICGGCRARAFATSGDYLTSEPYCLYQPLATKKSPL